MKFKGWLKKQKWLFRNLNFRKLMSYYFTKKPVVTENEYLSFSEPVTSFPIDEDIEPGTNGTLLIKPSGMHKQEMIKNLLISAGINIVKQVLIKDYLIYQENVFYKVQAEEKKIWSYILKKFYKENNNTAILLYLDKDIETIGEIKRTLRKVIGIDFYKIVSKDNTYVTSLTPIHSSTANERIYEESVITSMIKTNLAQEI